MKSMEKPKIKQLTMKEVNSKKGKNGYNVISTFSGAGGSSLGLKLAGFNILAANEFIPSAQEVYKLNHKNTFLDTRDIREIQPKEMLDNAGLHKGELDLFEGSPPCSAFSSAGIREKGWGEIKPYSETCQRVDDLFFEWIRLIEGLQPKMIVAENVKALSRGKAIGFLKEILTRIEQAGYNAHFSILNSAYLGVPQKRERIIIVGVRKDLIDKYEYPKPFNYTYSVKEAVPDYLENEKPSSLFKPVNPGTEEYTLLHLCQRYHKDKFSKINQQFFNKTTGFTRFVTYPHIPCHTITQSINMYHCKFMRTLSIDEIKKLQTFPIDFKLTGNFYQQWERIGRSVPPRMMEQIGLTIKNHLDIIYEEGG